MCTSKKSIHGFTLLELMITVVVIAILAAIAIPSYSDYVQRGKLSEAVGQLSTMRVKMEQWFQDNRTYLNSGGTACGPSMPSASDGAKYFTYTGACTASTYTITATGASAQGMNNFVYTLNQANSKSTTTVPTGWSGASSNCWVLKKDGSC
jgi:type IV pilus assembly protein PilE